jgi:dephospho-CoA kinase
VSKVLVTGMSGTGKSTALQALAERGRLRATATVEIDAAMPLAEVVRHLEDLA